MLPVTKSDFKCFSDKYNLYLDLTNFIPKAVLSQVCHKKHRNLTTNKTYTRQTDGTYLQLSWYFFYFPLRATCFGFYIKPSSDTGLKYKRKPTHFLKTKQEANNKNEDFRKLL